jgi:FAD dependent oxidoreductase
VKRVAIIGGGLFGLAAALETSDCSHVTVFEKSPRILHGASYGNQNRFHYGYHYPRSVATGRDCLDSLPDFVARFGESLLTDLANHYCIAKNGSKTSVEGYIEFCEELRLPHDIGWPSDSFLSRDRIAECFRVSEPIIDLVRLREIISKEVSRRPSIELRLEATVTDAKVLSTGQKRLTVASRGRVTPHDYDYVVDCTYAHLNEFAEWVGSTSRPFQFELVEIPVVRLATRQRVGVTIMDGPFCSLLPYGSSEESLLYHVEASVLDRAHARSYLAPECFDSNWESIVAQSADYIPIVGGSRYVRSIFAIRVVDPASENDDARRSVLRNHGDGCWSIFSGKLVAACRVAKELRQAAFGRDSSRS